MDISGGLDHHSLTACALQREEIHAHLGGVGMSIGATHRAWVENWTREAPPMTAGSHPDLVG